MKTFGVNRWSILPCREQPAHTAALSTQLILGETYTVLDQHDEWLLIENHHDGYVSWLRENQHTPCSEEFAHTQHKRQRFNQLVAPYAWSGQTTFATLGAILPDADEEKSALVSPHNWLQTALKLVNTPYVWGGRSPFGIDCSGFTQLVFLMHGISLPRDAWQQVDSGEIVNWPEEALSGDLAFFDNDQGKITHVGILTGKGTILHASGSVREDKLDHEGIFNTDLRKYTHKLRIIKRIFEEQL